MCCCIITNNCYVKYWAILTQIKISQNPQRYIFSIEAEVILKFLKLLQ